MKQRFAELKRSPAFSGMVLFFSFLVIYFIIQFIQDPAGFFTPKTYNNFTSIFKNFTPLILLTMGQALLMLMGIIDISTRAA